MSTKRLSGVLALATVLSILIVVFLYFRFSSLPRVECSSDIDTIRLECGDLSSFYRTYRDLPKARGKSFVIRAVKDKQPDLQISVGESGNVISSVMYKESTNNVEFLIQIPVSENLVEKKKSIEMLISKQVYRSLLFYFSDDKINRDPTSSLQVAEQKSSRLVKLSSNN